VNFQSDTVARIGDIQNNLKDARQRVRKLMTGDENADGTFRRIERLITFAEGDIKGIAYNLNKRFARPVKLKRSIRYKETLSWPKKDVGANVGVSDRPKRHKGSVGNAC